MITPYDPLDSSGDHTAHLPPLIDCDWRGDANRWLSAHAHTDERIPVALARFASAPDCEGECGPGGDAMSVTDPDDVPVEVPQ